MKLLKRSLLPAFGLCLLFPASTMHADSKNIADYPLRIHIYSRNETTFRHWRSIDEVQGEGRGNLFENGEPHGVDFTFDCDQKLKGSLAYETYRARWKKPGQSLTVLLPVFGKSNAFFTCEFKTDVKDVVYRSQDGHLRTESAAQFKQWMIKHDYDPEHDKNQPININTKTGEDQPDNQPQPTPAPQ